MKKERTTHVNNMYINSSSYSSIIQIGDTTRADPYLRAIAVQKEGAFFDVNDYPFSQFRLFTKPFKEIADNIPLQYQRLNHEFDINVHSVNIEATSGSAIIQLGSLKHLDAKSRIKHIRILADENEDT